jgi:hypothetical protein
MDWNMVIEGNREALKRIVAMLVAMAGLAGLTSPLAGEDGSARGGEAEPPAEPGEGVPTLPRHLYRAILRLLRPAESAVRRLIIVAARGLIVTLPPSRPRKAKPKSLEPVLRSLGIAVVTSGFSAPAAPKRAAAGRRTYNLPLLDPLKSFRPRRRYVPAHAAPRILLPGLDTPHRLPPPPAPDDPIDVTRLNLRLAALTAALDDLPGQAERFARWRARRIRERNNPAPGRIRRIWPLRPGRPPGGRLSRFDPSARRRSRIRDVDEILAHAHALALYALQYPDTS